MHPHTENINRNKNCFKGRKWAKNKKLLASIMVKQYNKHCVVKREHRNSEEGSRL